MAPETWARIAKAHAAQGFQRFGIVFHAGEDQTAALARQRRGALEQPGIMALHGFECVASERRRTSSRRQNP